MTALTEDMVMMEPPRPGWAWLCATICRAAAWQVRNTPCGQHGAGGNGGQGGGGATQGVKGGGREEGGGGLAVCGRCAAALQDTGAVRRASM